MSQSINQHESPTTGRFPYVTAATAALIGATGWYRNSSWVRNLTDVYPDSSWSDWATRWPGSFFKADPTFGEPTDTAISVASTALALGLTERRHGSTETVRLAATSQLLGCLATRTLAVTGSVPPENMHDLDVGSSAVTVALFAKFATEKFQTAREQDSVRGKIGWGVALGAAAVGLAVSTALDSDKTAGSSHLVGFAYGVIEALRVPSGPPPTQDFLYSQAAA